MAVVPNFRQTTMIEFVKYHVTPGSTVYTDGLKGFEELKAAGVTHVARAQPRQGEPLHHAAPSPTADGPRHLQTRRAVESPAK